MALENDSVSPGSASERLLMLDCSSQQQSQNV